MADFLEGLLLPKEVAIFFLKKKEAQALAMYVSWLEHCPSTPRLWVQSPVMAHTRINQ